MSSLSSLRLTVTIDNTRHFQRQGWRHTAGAGIVVLALGVAALVGCSSKEQAAAAKATKGAAKSAKAAVARENKETGSGHSTPQTLELLGAPPAGPAAGTGQGGILRVHLESDPPHLNPLLESLHSIDQVVRGLVFQTLLDCQSGDVKPGLVDTWEVAPDAHKVTLHLRNGVRFHDGHPFGILDVQASLEPLLRQGSPVPLYRELLADVAAVEIASDRTVRLKLHRPSDLALRALCEIPMLPEHLLRAGPTVAAAFGRQPIGTGPFRFAAWERGRRIRLVRNPDFWQTPVHLDEISFEIETDGTRAITRTRRGELDILPRVLDIHFPEQVEPAALQDGLNLYRLTPGRYSFLLLNHRHEFLTSAQVRQALSLLWDRARFSADLHRGLARPLGAPPFGHVAAAAFDRAAAGSLLDAAGYRDVTGDGIRDRANAVPIRLTVLASTGARTSLLELKSYALDLRRAGLLMDIVTVDPATLMARIKDGNYDLAPMIWDGQEDEDPRLLFGSPGEVSYSGYRSDRLQDLFDGIRIANTPALRRAAFDELAAHLARDLPVIFLYRHDVPALVGKRVAGLWGQGARLDLRNVWLNP